MHVHCKLCAAPVEALVPSHGQGSDAEALCPNCSADPARQGADAADRPRGRFDPAFREAVEAGRLTPAEAYARGKREAYAARLVERHGLAIETAYAVADNRIPLAQVLHDRVAHPSDGSVSEGTGRSWPIVIAVIFVLTALGIARLGREDAVAPPPAPIPASAEPGLLTDASGRVVRVIGADPEEVLLKYCRGSRGRRLEPVGVMPAASASAPVRIGVIRDARAPRDLLAIAIREDDLSGRWFSGDGHNPLEPRDAPEGAADLGRSVGR